VLANANAMAKLILLIWNVDITVSIIF